MRDHGNAVGAQRASPRALLVLDRARLSPGCRCQGNFKPTIVPATCRVGIYRLMYWKFLSTGRRGEEIAG
jgi:hypothetical protein